MISKLIVGAGTAALAFSVLAVAAAPSAKADCKGHSHTGRADGTLQFVVRSRARGDWSRIVNNHDGVKYANWRNSKDQALQCDKTGPRLVWRCRFTARPCS